MIQKELKILDSGQNNKININVDTKINNLEIIIKGNNNEIVIESGAWIRNSSINIESSFNKIYIGNDVIFTGKMLMKIIDSNTISIGSHSSIGNAYFLCGEGRTISIGKDCMIAYGIEFRTTDSHPISDVISGVRINSAEDIIIGDHVWIGAYVTILKGSVVMDNSVIAIKSLISSKFDKGNVVIAGVPGKIVRTGVNWSRTLVG